MLQPITPTNNARASQALSTTNCFARSSEPTKFLTKEQLSSLVTDPERFPSLCELVKENGMGFSPSKFSNEKSRQLRMSEEEEMSLMLQRCPNSSPLINHQDCGTDFILNSMVFRKFKIGDIETMYHLFVNTIKVENRCCKRKHVFENCFDGSQAVSVVSEIIIGKFSPLLSDCSATKLATYVCQYFLTTGRFEHVCREHCFKNVSTLLYHFPKKRDSTTFPHFSNLTVSQSPNWYLTYPSVDSFVVQRIENSQQLFQCNIPIENSAPIFNNVTLSELRDLLLLEILPNEEGVEMISRQDDIYLFTFIQRTKFQELPDYITLQFLSIMNNCNGVKSSIAVYSRCKYGYSDWGGNKERVQDWLSKLFQKSSILSSKRK